MGFSLSFILIFYFIGLFFLFYSIYNFLIVLLRMEFLILCVYIYLNMEIAEVVGIVEIIFVYVCVMVLEGVLGLCLLVKSYRGAGGNIYLR